MLRTKKVIFQANGETLVGYIRSQKVEMPSMLFIYGGGIATTCAYLSNITTFIAQQGIATFCFDYAGNGESTGDFRKETLEKRVNEVKAALSFLNPQKPISVFGSSMAGHILFKMLPEIKIDNLLLIAPAIYSKDAYSVPFTGEFSKVIRAEDSWKNSDVLVSLDEFKGNVFLATGGKDDVIPKGVTELIKDHLQGVTKKKIVTFANMGHFLVKDTRDDPQFAKRLGKMIISFIKA